MKSLFLALAICATVSAQDTSTFGKVKSTLANGKTFETYSLDYSTPVKDLGVAKVDGKVSIVFDGNETYGTTNFGYSAWGFGLDLNRSWKNFDYGVGASYATESIKAGTATLDGDATYWNWHVKYNFKNYVFGYESKKAFGTPTGYNLSETTTLSVGMKF